eukprot:TRINITY_DN3559_c1_g1_i1.p1 TRINITY_DN3559_c1_g1~~TRINITY_DN3559_c1_g1_i1.p1  ORF type:complete len:135 (-),score=25.98 TRINITY_DN3559_c1_g1_i1:72-476(-)
MIATGTSEYSSIVIGNKTVDRFRIKILSHRNHEKWQSSIGLVPTRELDLEDCPENSWAIGIDNGKLIKDVFIDSDLKYNPKVGDEIELYHNQEEGTISLYVNKVDKGVIFSDVPTDMELYPYFNCGGKGSVQIV